MEQNYDLVVIIVQQRLEQKVMDAMEEAGAHAATSFYAKGRGVRHKLGNWGLLIQPEKVVILTATHEKNTLDIIAAVKKAADLSSPASGLVFSTKIYNLEGIFKEKI